MIMHVFSVFDIAAGVYGKPLFGTARGSVLRSFVDEVNRVAEDNAMNGHPEDFDLYALGEFDDATAKFSLYDVPERVMRAVDAHKGNK